MIVMRNKEIEEHPLNNNVHNHVLQDWVFALTCIFEIETDRYRDVFSIVLRTQEAILF